MPIDLAHNWFAQDKKSDGVEIARFVFVFLTPVK